MAKPQRAKIPNVAATPSKLAPLHKQGPKRAFFSTTPSAEYLKRTLVSNSDKIIALSLFLVSIALKSIDLKTPFVIVFDEVHVVKQVNKYIDGDFFRDVTPPLSKLIYTLVAYLCGYRGDASSLNKAGQGYENTDFPYVALRFFTVVLSSLTLPLCYLTLRANGVRGIVSGVTSSLLLLENLTVLHSRVFTPDSFFLLGVSLSVYSFTMFNNAKQFSVDWFRYLALTSIGLGLSVSTKWIGLSTIAWVVAVSLFKMWFIAGDLDLTNCQIWKHAGYRLSFIIVPGLIYLGTFFLHLTLLKNHSRDASALSPHFQRSLDFNDISDVPQYVTFGSTVTIRHTDSLGGYLHSHKFKYKTGSRNNQVTVFNNKDYNNEWVVEPLNNDYNKEDPRIRLDTQVRLRHKLTGLLLSVSDSKPPISEQEYDFEVNCFGNSTYKGDKAENFWLRAVADRYDNKMTAHDAYLTSFDTPFQLRNDNKGCTILSHDLKLPDWGFNQQEVICIKSALPERSTFIIESIKYPKDFNSSLPIFKEHQPRRDPSFLSKFIELNSKMFKTFKDIKPNNASPLLWPLDVKGMRFTTLKNSSLYAIGNPVVFGLATAVIPVFISLKVLDLFRTDYIVERVTYKTNAFVLVLGYLFHFLPYVLQEGEWFVGYYLPSLYFGVLLIGVTFEFIYFKNTRFAQIVLLISAISALRFYTQISPITFGSKWTKEKCESAKLFDGWEFRCDTYQD